MSEAEFAAVLNSEPHKTINVPFKICSTIFVHKVHKKETNELFCDKHRLYLNTFIQ